ncbi:unnamed protein product [Lota lota]
MEWPGDFPQDHAFMELLVPGVPSEMDYQQLLQDTEEKLNLNACSIEQSLKELQAKMGDSSTGDRPASPTEILQWLSLQNTTGTRPVTTGHQEIMDFLKALQQYLGSDEEGREEAVLQLLVNLSSQCGISFSCPPSPSSSCPLAAQQAASSFPVVNVLRDNSSLEVQEVWDDVRRQLRRHLMGRLSSCCLEDQGPKRLFTLSLAERVHCLQQLCFLHPESEVLSHYQVARSQWVLSVLRAGLSSCPAGETGFDRVSSAFSAARPALIQAVSEELQALGRITETLHTVMAFLDAAYLAPLARELASMMASESETAVKHNTTLSGRILRYSAKSRATVAPIEPPKNGRSFSMTSHQLASLARLACTLLRLESAVEELAVNMAYINGSKDTPCVKGILKKTREETREETCAMGADLSRVPGEHLLHSPEAPLLADFDWRSAFRGLVPQMAHCVTVVLEDVCTKSLQQEEASFTSGQTLIELSTCAGHTPITVGDQLAGDDSSQTWPEMDTPRMIAKFCAAILAELEALLPLAVACRDGPLTEVRSSFVEACARVTSAALSRVEERALQVPASAPLKNLPALLASCACISQRLAHYHARLSDSGPTMASTRVPLTLLPIQRYKDMVEALRDQLTSYSVQVCSTSILHDAESHYWTDPKPFYEGEHCSFSLQMWFYFLCGLRSDLWAVLPASLARGVLAQVLGETLQLLVQRYSSARPSYKRHPQIRCDITAVLLYVEQLMPSVSESPEALVRPLTSPAAATGLQDVDWSARIHHLCDQLLTVMVIGTAPLPMLYGNFMSESVKDSEATNPHGFIRVHWLHALHPDLYPERSLSDGLVGPAACACQLRLLTSDPGYSPRLLLRTLLHGDCHLPRTLLEHSYLCGESGSEVSPEDSEAGSDFVAALFNLLSVLSAVPQALTQALEPYLDRGHVWEHLYSLPDTTRSVPPLVSCVRAVISRPAHCLLGHLVSMVMAWQGAEEPNRVLLGRAAPQSVLSRVPREWNYNPQEARRNEPAAKSVLPLAVQALSLIFTNLPIAVASLPLPVRFLFQAAEKRLSQHARQLRSTGLLLWALLGCLVQCLEDPDTTEQVSGVALNRGAKDCLALLAECLQATMGIQLKGVPKPAVHKVLQALEDNRPNWTALMLQKARKLSSDSAFERRRWESAGAQERGGGVATAAAVAMAPELTEQKIGLMLLEVCHGAGGSPYLRQIHHIIRGNEELLMSRLAGNTDATHRANFDPGSESDVAPSRFNPLVQFDHIGREKLEQSAVADWTWDWPRLLPAYQAMSRVTFTTLLANRWEMQDDAALEDEERVLVEKLKAVFYLCDCAPRGNDDEDAPRASQTQTESPLEDAKPPGEKIPR